MENKLFLVLLVIFSLCACKNTQNSSNSEMNTIEAIHDIWTVDEKPVNGERPYIEFNTNTMKAYGNDGVFEFQADLKASPGNLKLKHLMKIDSTTLPSSDFVEKLKNVRHYSRKNLKLLLLDKNNKEIIQLKKVD